MTTKELSDSKLVQTGIYVIVQFFTTSVLSLFKKRQRR